MTSELSTQINSVMEAYTVAENSPRVACTRCHRFTCLDLPWIAKPICDPCWDKIEAQGKSQTEAEEYLARRKLSNIPSGYWNARFSDFKQIQNPYQQHQQGVARRIFDSVRQAGKGTLIFGPPGTGKTHLLACAANQLLHFGNVAWLDLQKLKYELGRSVFQKGQEPVEPFGKRVLRETAVIIIDDFSFDSKPYDWLCDEIRGFFNDLVAQSGDVKLYLSSNNLYTPEKITDPVTQKVARDQDLPSLLDIFGKATISRLKQLTTPTPFVGPDRRLAA